MSDIQVSASALQKIKELLEDEANAAMMLRVFVTGGGCSGFQYGFTFDEVQADDDLVIESDHIRVVIDSLSCQYMEGAVIDYSEGLDGARFKIENPQASTTCGCGSSFSV